MRYVLPDGRFWEGEVEGAIVSLRWGDPRDPKARRASFKSPAAAKKEFATLEKKIISMGYRKLGSAPREVIAALAANPSDDSPLVVYGDELLAAGDLRGELASLAARKKSKALRDFLMKHASALFGEAEDDVHEGRASDLTWAPGFVRDVRFVAEDDDADLVALTRRFVGAPVAAFLRGVKFSRAPDGAWGSAVQELKRLPAPELINTLQFTDDVGGDGEWYIDAGDFQGVWSSFPGLRSLEVVSGGFEPGALVLPELRSFERKGGNYAHSEVKAYQQAKWPKLESVTLGFAHEPEAEADNSELAVIKHFLSLGGALRSLGLQDIALPATTIEDLLDGDTLPRLEFLDLSTCSVDDEGGSLLFENLDVLKKVKSIHLPRSETGNFELSDFDQG